MQTSCYDQNLENNKTPELLIIVMLKDLTNHGHIISLLGRAFILFSYWSKTINSRTTGSHQRWRVYNKHGHKNMYKEVQYVDSVF